MNHELAALDRALARKGETITLRRTTGTTTQTTFDVQCRAFVRGYAAEELVGGISQTDSLVVISPADLIRDQWPGGQPPGTDARLPRKGDKAIIAGKVRNVETVGPIYIGSDLARIEMRVLG